MIVATCCMEGNIQNVLPLKKIVRDAGSELMIISTGPLATHQWTPETWKSDLDKADVVLCVAHANNDQPCKSNNRVAQAQSMGKVVLASPLPAYLEAIEHGQSGFICRELIDWRDYLVLCRDQELRERIGKHARTSAKGYSPENLAGIWDACLTAVTTKKPPVDIIIPTWNNLDYLKETITSIRKNTDWPHTITVVDSGTDSAYWLSEQPDIKTISSPTRLHFSEAVNQGITSTRNPYVAILNDDLIVTENWLNNLMFEAQKGGTGGVNGFSNCDKSWLHNEDVVVGGVDLHPSMTLAEVQHVIPQIYKLTHKKKVQEREWLAYFCTLIPRHVIDRVGLLDEAFKSGCEDYEHSKRITAAGFRMVTTFDAVIFHFGGCSRKRSEQLDPAQHRAEDAHNQALMAQKCSPRPDALPDTSPCKSNTRLKIAIYTGPAWEVWDLDTPKTTGIGGSETCAGHLAKELVRQGHSVNMYGQHNNLTQHNVKLHHYTHFNPKTEYDLLIVSRNLDIITDKIRAKKVYAWCHDVCFQGSGITAVQLWKVDKFIALTPQHRDLLIQYHPNIPLNKLVVIPNGFDQERYSPGTKIPGRMIYASSPDRGLDVLLHLYPNIKQAVPEASLTIAYGFDNWEKALKARGTEAEIAHMNQMKDRIKELAPLGVKHLGRVNQVQLAEEFKQASLFAYPSHFFETSCLTVLEAFASGTPVLTSKLGGLISTVGDAGILLEGHSRETPYCQAFYSHTVKLLTSKTDLAMKGLERVKQFSWDRIAKLWV